MPSYSSSSAIQWLSLVCMIWLQTLNGTNYNFSAYSSQLKNHLSITQIQLYNLAFASDAGKLFGWIPVIVAAHVPLWLVLMIGVTFRLVGYGVQYLFITNRLPINPSYWQLFLLSVIAGNSICWINTVCFQITIRNFALIRHVVLGLSTSYQGLSGKIYTDIVGASFTLNPTKRANSYLLLNSILPLLVGFITLPLARDVKREITNNMAGGFCVMFAITMATGIYVIVSNMRSITSQLSPVINVIYMGMLIALLIVPVAVKIRDVVKELGLINRDKKVHDVTIDQAEEDGGRKATKQSREGIQFGYHEMETREEVGVKEMIKTADFWLYFFVYLFGPTLGLVYLNNLGQITETRGNSRASSLVSLSSSFAFFGRLIPCLADYLFSRSKYMISRPMSIAVLMAMISGAFFLLLSTDSTVSLYISTSVIGICSGAITSTSIYMTTELFGKQNFSLNQSAVITNIPIGSFLFGNLAAILYHKKGRIYEDGKCLGKECYGETFLAFGSLCFVGTVLAITLYFRTRKFYFRKN